jgi:hypothetical protein
VTAWLLFRQRGRAPWPGPHRGPGGRAGGPHTRGARAGPADGGYGSAALFLISLVSRPSPGAWTRRHFARRAASRRRSFSTTATSYGPPTPPSSKACACSRLHSPCARAGHGRQPLPPPTPRREHDKSGNLATPESQPSSLPSCVIRLQPSPVGPALWERYESWPPRGVTRRCLPGGMLLRGDPSPEGATGAVSGGVRFSWQARGSAAGFGQADAGLQPAQRRGRVPGGTTEYPLAGRHQHGAYERRVDDHREPCADAE